MSDPTAPAPERTACCGDHCTATATHGPGAFPVACWQHAGDWPEIPAPPPSEAPPTTESARPVPLSTADLDGLERSLDAGRTWEPDEATARWVLGVLRRASEPAAPGGEERIWVDDAHLRALAEALAADLDSRATQAIERDDPKSASAFELDAAAIVRGLLERWPVPATGGDSEEAITRLDDIDRLATAVADKLDPGSGTRWGVDAIAGAAERIRAAVTRLAANNERLTREATLRDGAVGYMRSLVGCADHEGLSEGIARLKGEARRLAARVAELEAAARGKGAT